MAGIRMRKRVHYKKRRTARATTSTIKKVIRRSKETQVIPLTQAFNSALDTYPHTDVTDSHWTILDITPVLGQGDVQANMIGTKAYLKSLRGNMMFRFVNTVENSTSVVLRFMVLQCKGDISINRLFNPDTGTGSNWAGLYMPIMSYNNVRKVIKDKLMVFNSDDAIVNSVKVIPFGAKLNHKYSINVTTGATSIWPYKYYIIFKAYNFTALTIANMVYGHGIQYKFSEL